MLKPDILQVDLYAFNWVGGDAEIYLDEPAVTTCRRVVIGRYGGRTAAGAHKNEDGALVWCTADGSWEFAMVVDAHHSSQSTALVVATVEGQVDAIRRILTQEDETAFDSLREHLVGVFRSPEFRERCRTVRGEASCMVCVRKGRYLWWFSVGDCVAYLFHPMLARLGQYALNQRAFYEWIGELNTFDLPVPCFTSGVRELRKGHNVILLTTDGLLEFGKRPFEDPVKLYRVFGQLAKNPEDVMLTALRRVHDEGGRDSATVVAWSYDVPQDAPPAEE